MTPRYPKFKCPHCDGKIQATTELYDQLGKVPPDVPLTVDECRWILEGEAIKLRSLDKKAVIDRLNELARKRSRTA